MPLNMLIHCGGNHVERSTLNTYDMPEPTDRYMPIAHGNFADMIEDRLDNIGFKFGEQAHAIGRNGNHYFGMAELRGGESFEDWGLVAGWRSSYDKTLSASFVIGSQVFVCDNLAFSGDIKIGRKHTTNLLRDLPNMIDDAIMGTAKAAQDQEQRYSLYHQAKMKDHIANHAIIQMLRQDIITTSRVEKVVNEYYEPSHVEHGRGTVWTLFNAATEALKGSGLPTLPERTVKLHDLMDKASRFAA